MSLGIIFLGNAQSSQKKSLNDQLIVSLLIENNKQIADMRKEMMDMRKEFQQQLIELRKEFQQQREADRKEFKQDIYELGYRLDRLESKVDNIMFFIFGTLFLGVVGFFVSMFKEELKPRIIKRFFSIHKTSEVKTYMGKEIDTKLVIP